MIYQSKQLREQRAAIAKQIADLVVTAKKENRPLNAEEQQQFDKMDAEQKRCLTEAEGYERMERFADEAVEDKRSLKSGLKIIPEQLATGEERMDAIRAWLLAPAAPIVGTNKKFVRAAKKLGVDLRSNAMVIKLGQQARGGKPEQRALSHTASAGGNLIPDEAMAALEKALLTYGGMRQAATVIRTDTGAPLPVPNINDTSNTGALITENTENTGDADPVYGQTVFGAYTYTSKIVRVPFELMQDSLFDLASHLGEILGERLGRITNTAYTVHDGSSKPNGIVNAATSGKTAASATAFTYGELVDLMHSVDSAYRSGPKVYWMGHDTTLAHVKKMVDDNNRPLWQPSIDANSYDTVMGYQYIVNNDVAEIEADAKVLLFGDFSKFWIRDVQDVVVQRSDERYMEFRQSAFVAFLRTDSDAIWASGSAPVKYLTMGAEGGSGSG